MDVIAHFHMCLDFKVDGLRDFKHINFHHVLPLYTSKIKIYMVLNYSKSLVFNCQLLTLY
jgi:hypothetical protein